jgi:hypothetical protein
MSNVESVKPRSIAAKSPDYSTLLAHELADTMSMIEGNPYIDFKADLKTNGLKNKIVLFQDRILDGRNRYKALKELGHTFTEKDFETFTGTYADAEAFVISTNMMRRQMSNADKAKVVERMIAKYSDDGDRAIAKRCGMSSHSFVANVRERMENPPGKKEFEKVCKLYNKLEDRWRAEFAKKFSRDLREVGAGL